MHFWSILGVSGSGGDDDWVVIPPLDWEVVKFGETVLDFLVKMFRYWILCLLWFAVG